MKSRFQLGIQPCSNSHEQMWEELLVDLCNQGPPTTRPHQHYADSGGHCGKLQIPGCTRRQERKTPEEARLQKKLIRRSPPWRVCLQRMLRGLRSLNESHPCTPAPSAKDRPHTMSQVFPPFCSFNCTFSIVFSLI